MSAGKWIGPVAKAVGGGGGGRPDLAQAGGKEPAKLPEALDRGRADDRRNARRVTMPLLAAA